MVALYPDDGSLRALKRYGWLNEPDIHMTLASLGNANDMNQGQVQAAILAASMVAESWQRGPLTGVVGGHGVFSSASDPDTAIVVALPDIPDLHDFRTLVTQTLEDFGVPYSRDHGFTPHITGTYAKRNNMPVITTVQRTNLRFSGITVKIGADRYDYLFGMSPVEKASKQGAGGKLQSYGAGGRYSSGSGGATASAEVLPGDVYPAIGSTQGAANNSEADLATIDAMADEIIAVFQNLELSGVESLTVNAMAAIRDGMTEFAASYPDLAPMLDYLDVLGPDQTTNLHASVGVTGVHLIAGVQGVRPAGSIILSISYEYANNDIDYQEPTQYFDSSLWQKALNTQFGSHSIHDSESDTSMPFLVSAYERGGHARVMAVTTHELGHVVHLLGESNRVRVLDHLHGPVGGDNPEPLTSLRPAQYRSSPRAGLRPDQNAELDTDTVWTNSEIPSVYARYNNSEQFAETFALRPERRTPNQQLLINAVVDDANRYAQAVYDGRVVSRGITSGPRVAVEAGVNKMYEDRKRPARTTKYPVLFEEVDYFTDPRGSVVSSVDYFTDPSDSMVSYVAAVTKFRTTGTNPIFVEMAPVYGWSTPTWGFHFNKIEDVDEASVAIALEAAGPGDFVGGSINHVTGHVSIDRSETSRTREQAIVKAKRGSGVYVDMSGQVLTLSKDAVPVRFYVPTDMPPARIVDAIRQVHHETRPR